MDRKKAMALPHHVKTSPRLLTQHSQQQTPQLRNHRHVFNQRVESREEGALQVMGMPNIDRKTRRVVTTLKKQTKKNNNSGDATDNKERGGVGGGRLSARFYDHFNTRVQP